MLGIAGERWNKQNLSGIALASEQLIFDQVYKEWLEREELLQATGVYRSDPNEMSLIDMLQNMTPQDRQSFIKNVAGYVATEKPSAP